MLGGVASVTACNGSAPPPREPRPRLATATDGVDPRGTKPRPSRRATIKYEIRGRPFPLPVVRGTIAGHETLMLVDTGANSHVVAGWLARKLGLALKKLGDVGTDHVGKTISTFRIEKPELAIDDWGALEGGPVLATDVPDVIERLGIGAFISPQRLVEDGDAVVLDLERGEIRSALWDDAHGELSASGTPMVLAEHAPRACEEKDGPIKGLAYVVPATVASERVQLLVDTGAQHSDLFTSSAAGQRLLAQSVGNREPMYTASGKISARKLRSARVAAGAFAVTADVDLIAGAADASCARDGVLAMDVLRSCTLLLGRSRIFGRCSASPGAAPPIAKAKPPSR